MNRSGVGKMYKFKENIKLHIPRVFVLLLLSVLLTGCGGDIWLRPNMKKVDDEISKAIYEKVGKRVSYEKRDETTYGVLQYFYLILDDEDENILASMAEAINEVLGDNDIGKIELIIWEEGSRQAYFSVLCLSNFNLYLDDSQYGPLYYLSIYGNRDKENSLYNQSTSYPAMEGIEYLRVINKVTKAQKRKASTGMKYFLI